MSVSECVSGCGHVEIFAANRRCPLAKHTHTHTLRTRSLALPQRCQTHTNTHTLSLPPSSLSRFLLFLRLSLLRLCLSLLYLWSSSYLASILTILFNTPDANARPPDAILPCAVACPQPRNLPLGSMASTHQHLQHSPTSSRCNCR